MILRFLKYTRATDGIKKSIKLQLFRQSYLRFTRCFRIIGGKKSLKVQRKERSPWIRQFHCMLIYANLTLHVKSLFCAQFYVWFLFKLCSILQSTTNTTSNHNRKIKSVLAWTANTEQTNREHIHRQSSTCDHFDTKILHLMRNELWMCMWKQRRVDEKRIDIHTSRGKCVIANVRAAFRQHARFVTHIHNARQSVRRENFRIFTVCCSVYKNQSEIYAPWTHQTPSFVHKLYCLESMKVTVNTRLMWDFRTTQVNSFWRRFLLFCYL